jgi:predicted secreted protein
MELCGSLLEMKNKKGNQMNMFLKTISLLLVFLAVTTSFATSKKKVIKKVHHITTVEDDTKPLTIKMKKGKLEGVKLPVKMATGYSWSLTKLGDNLKQPFKPRVIQPKNTGGVQEVGSKEYQIFYIRATEKGEGSVGFEYKQPFDKDSMPEKEFTLNIEVE